MDTFAKKYIAAIKEAKTDEDLEKIINAIYESGFEDGNNEADGHNLRSDCHKAPVERHESSAGHYYRCTVCNDPCDIEEIE
jgi:hypothetical protein